MQQLLARLGGRYSGLSSSRRSSRSSLWCIQYLHTMRIHTLSELSYFLHAFQSLAGMSPIAGQQLRLQILAGRHLVRRCSAHKSLVHTLHCVGVLFFQNGVGRFEVFLQLHHALLPQLVVLDQLLVHLALNIRRTDGVSASLHINGRSGRVNSLGRGCRSCWRGCDRLCRRLWCRRLSCWFSILRGS